MVLRTSPNTLHAPIYTDFTTHDSTLHALKAIFHCFKCMFQTMKYINHCTKYRSEHGYEFNFVPFVHIFSVL